MISSNTAFGGSSTFGQPRKSGLLSHNPCSIPCRSRGYTRSGILACFFVTVTPTGIFEFHPSDEFFVQRLSVTRGVRQRKPYSFNSTRCTAGLRTPPNARFQAPPEAGAQRRL